MASSPPDFARQVRALVKKNLVLLLTRHWISTLLLTAVAPVVVLSLTLNINNFSPIGSFSGLGSPARVRSLPDAIPNSQKLVFVRPENLGSDVDIVIKSITKLLSSNQWTQFSNRRDARRNCNSNARGVSGCYAIITFNDSPLSDVGLNKTWNYALRFDPARYGARYDYDSDMNSDQAYWSPTQMAVQNAITGSTEMPDVYSFSSVLRSIEDIAKKLMYGRTVISTYHIVFFLSVLPSIYHVVNVITIERDSGLSELIDTMGGSASARVLSNIVAFTIIYSPTWLIFGCLYWYLLFPDSNPAIPIFWQLFSGSAFLNASIFAAAFFKTRRISSIFVVVCFCCLGGGAAISLSKRVTTSQVIPLSLFFPSMNYIYVLSHMARFAIFNAPVQVARDNFEGLSIPIQIQAFLSPQELKDILEGQSYFVSVVIFWVLLILQSFFYPVLAIIAEHLLHGLNFKGRAMTKTKETEDSTVAIQTTGLAKVYPTTWHRNLLGFGKNRDGLRALNGLDLVVRKRQVLCLLGVNGAGKSTTLDLVSGFQTQTAGTISINAGPSQLGVCPQRNVLFERLTVLEHVRFWSNMKSGKEDRNALHELIAACDLATKTHSQAGTLSGGQKRKLQLACMFAGGTTVCLMDEVTSGLDPISRRAIWNIILAERSKRSMVFTTHFLDEGEVLADYIVILSKGQIKCQGSKTELKNGFGGGYRVYTDKAAADVAEIDAPRTIHQDQVIFRTPNSRSASRIVGHLEEAGYSQVQIAGPTIEDVFLQVAQADVSTRKSQGDPTAATVTGHLSSGKATTFFQQVRILMLKRLKVLPRYWPAAFLALSLPIACMPALNTFIAVGFVRPSCLTRDLQADREFADRNGSYYGYNFPLSFYNYANGTLPQHLPFGPPSSVPALRNVLSSFPIGKSYHMEGFDGDWDIQSDYSSFQASVRAIPPRFSQGGVYLGDASHAATIATNSMSMSGGYSTLMSLLNIYASIRSGIQMDLMMDYNYAPFTRTGDFSTSTYVLYATLILAVYPAFFALYPAFERVNKIRALQCSNGVRPLPMWTAYFLIDLIFVLAVSMAFTLTISQQFPFWWEPAYMFPICLLHGITGILVGYIISTRASSQLASFLWTLGLSGLAFFVMALGYILPSVQSDPLDAERNADIVAYTLGLFFPIGGVFRGIAVGVNMLQLACRDDGSESTAGSWWGYGFPIVYLIVQVVALCALLVWLDSDLSFSLLLRRPNTRGAKQIEEDERKVEEEKGYGTSSATSFGAGVHKEATRVKNDEQDLLRMVHVSKSFSGHAAVDDVSLGLGQGEILALLGPNGAGKTTIVNMIRGELRPSRGEIFLRDVSVTRHPRQAQQAIGVCPQFDAPDLLTARQHLIFYAQIKGVPAIAVKSNVEIAMARVGLTDHADKQAIKLSGGNRRKLSLAIALMGNPAVLVLDEPSSSMDAAAKRAMWDIIRSEIAVPGRSLLLTTHSMEEADALATRAAILNQGNLLAIGTTRALRQEYSNLYHVQLLLKTAPHSSEEEMLAVEAWVKSHFEDVRFEGRSLAGQINFMVPASLSSSSSSVATAAAAAAAAAALKDEDTISAISSSPSSLISPSSPSSDKGDVGNVSYLIRLLEKNRDNLGLQDYSIGAPTLERVFLGVVKDSYVEEEGMQRTGIARLLRKFVGRA
ncbi:hypothetical protein B0H63DRAFT_486711 [Podospora didyma]|uniref:ABC transporter domain-containing protein n=1 Tax=Podospora didyma TaxID=330526 RepID=A0AAE0K612_9PEZI|nr:hypothetical protein B0H63DRAFT_486711 [Podospora didyma]